MSGNLEVIASALKRIQTEGGSGNYVIFTPSGSTPYYAQLTGEPGSPALYAEVVSNAFLNKQAQLADVQIARLRALGWIEPARGEKSNFHREWTAANDDERRAIAQIILNTLVEVYQVDIYSPLGVEFEFGA